jgi:hypothetical protein
MSHAATTSFHTKTTTDLRIGLTELVTSQDRLREIFKSFDFRFFQHYRLLVARDARLELATSSGADIGDRAMVGQEA